MSPSPEGAGHWTYCLIVLRSVDILIISQSGAPGTNEVGGFSHTERISNFRFDTHGGWADLPTCCGIWQSRGFHSMFQVS
jgi:hypothetical protein